jgi:preprotein translocase subunit SecF
MVNRSLNQVLIRSINTSLVALLPVGSLLFVGTWVFGGLALKDFALALFVGLLTGAYSSIFVATPLLAWLKEKEPKYKALRVRAAADLAKAQKEQQAAARKAPIPPPVEEEAIAAAAVRVATLEDDARSGCRRRRRCRGARRSRCSGRSRGGRARPAAGHTRLGCAPPSPAARQEEAPLTVGDPGSAR